MLNDSGTTITFPINSANNCSFYMDIFSANKTIHARSTKGCDFSNLQNEKQYIGQTFNVSMRAVSGSSTLVYKQPILWVKIVDSFVSADDCRMVYGHQADQRPSYYYQNYQYMTKCGDPFENQIMTQRIRTKGSTSSQNTVGESVIKVTACNMYSACADGEIQLSSDLFKAGDEGEIRLETYGDWYG